MPNVSFLHPDGRQQTLELPAGDSVMHGAVAHGIAGIVAECGGNAMCATCHVYVEPEFLALLPAMSADEDALLDGTASDRLPNSRLSCQIEMTAALDGLVVRLPEQQV
ncbi:2Fe-2S iron-sulfur cluster-binding protein [Roseomonas sp. BN140053]|uniref:2Fe-2S iron-sulfur cluster-binding protein n=1 Tax=Roseomonas sp. BN140053 TaxID=3391898 RepID=UPI0039EB3332